MLTCKTLVLGKCILKKNRLELINDPQFSVTHPYLAPSADSGVSVRARLWEDIREHKFGVLGLENKLGFESTFRKSIKDDEEIHSFTPFAL